MVSIVRLALSISSAVEALMDWKGGRILVAAGFCIFQVGDFSFHPCLFPYLIV